MIVVDVPAPALAAAKAGLTPYVAVTAMRCPLCGGRTWHTGGGEVNDCGRCDLTGHVPFDLPWWWDRRITIVARPELPADGTEYGDWAAAITSDGTWLLDQRGRGAAIDVKLEPVTQWETAVLDVWPAVAWDSSDGIPFGYPDNGPVVQIEPDHPDGPGATLWMSGDGEVPDDDLTAHMVWNREAWTPGATILRIPRHWHGIKPDAATSLRLPADGIIGPLNELGEPCPWPWEPQQLKGAPMGQYHCPHCGAMCMAGLPHPDYRDAPTPDGA